MDSTLLAGIIGGGCTVLAAILGQKGILDKVLKSKTSILSGSIWNSVWQDKDKSTGAITIRTEKLYITYQRGTKIKGYITADAVEQIDKRWEFDGNYENDFLQLYYYPSKKATNRHFLDYGCYFFKRMTDGSFKGYSVGIAWEALETSSDNIDISNHTLKRIN